MNAILIITLAVVLLGAAISLWIDAKNERREAIGDAIKEANECIVEHEKKKNI